MNILKHASEQPFIFATGGAALVHSTWTLAVMFAGEPPAIEWVMGFSIIPDLFTFVVYWLTAGAIAFALDVGQIVTSAEIRASRRGWGVVPKLFTFVVLAGATWYLQFLYIAHHIPDLGLAEGVRDEWQPIIALMRDLAIFIIPALLPASTILYTFGAGKSVATHEQIRIEIERAASTQGLITDGVEGALGPDDSGLIGHKVSEQNPLVFEATAVASGGFMLLDNDPERHYIECPDCDWSGTYDTETQAKRALAGHTRACNQRISIF